MLVTLSGVVLLAACSGYSAPSVAPNPALPRAGSHRFVNHDACPRSGPIVYVSDFTNNVINVYSGPFAGQAPCAQVGFGFLFAPVGLYVQAKTHDLYAVNSYNYNTVLVFHRGQYTPYNIYKYPVRQEVVAPWDVAVAKDGTIIVTSDQCDISTWTGGPNGGTFVNNYPMGNCDGGYTGWLAIDKNDTVYFDDVIGDQRSAFWSVSCPLGACGSQHRVRLRVPRYEGGSGMAFDSAGDLLLNDGTADTFKLPNLKPSTFALAGSAWGVAINEKDTHWFVADIYGGVAEEYAYPSGRLIGTVPINPGDGTPAGIAFDP
jgi:hypothetical protein